MAVLMRAHDGGEAFRTLYDTHAPRVRGLARRLLRDAGAIDDVVQETMLRAYRAGIHLDEGRDPWPWLASVTRNLCRDAARRTTRRPQEAFEESMIPAATPAADRIVENRARAQLVSAALDSLADHQRDLLVRHHVEEIPCARIAADTDTTVEAVKSGLARAREAFRSCYEGWRGAIPQALTSLSSRLWPRPPGAARVGALAPGVGRPVGAAALAAVLAFGLSAPPGIASPPEAAPTSGSKAPRVQPSADGSSGTSVAISRDGRLINFVPPESLGGPAVPGALALPGSVPRTPNPLRWPQGSARPTGGNQSSPSAPSPLESLPAGLPVEPAPPPVVVAGPGPVIEATTDMVDIASAAVTNAPAALGLPPTPSPRTPETPALYLDS